MAATDDIIDLGYYENERSEIFSLVDPAVMTILDIGCGKGVLGETLKKAVPGRRVFGIEFNNQAAQAASKKLDGVLQGDVQAMELKFEKGMFDLMIFADILEHLVEPERALERLKPYLKLGGTIIASIPNMRHYTVILRLIRRGWIYDNFGHFDRTHLRFFSLESMKTLISGAGFSIEQVAPRLVASKKIKLANGLLFGKLEDFMAFQYIIKARNPA